MRLLMARHLVPRGHLNSVKVLQSGTERDLQRLLWQIVADMVLHFCQFQRV